MADFCKECSIKYWGMDTADLKQENVGFYESLCEGCGGYIIHDETGKRDQQYPILHPLTLEPIIPSEPNT